MYKALFISLFTIALIGGFGWSYADSTHVDWDKCHDGRCIVEVPSLEQTPYKNPPLETHVDYMFNIFLPDGTCNITGHMMSDGSCNVPELVLDESNYTALKNNVAFMTVLSQQTTAKPTTNYCPLAQNIWDHQTPDYQAKLLSPTNLFDKVIPPYCDQELGKPIPEFGSFGAVILAISVISVIAYKRYT